jgi:hypothetical protein
MAQTRRKRQTKHRGNAAGMIESRGRTGRKPTTAEKRGTAAPSGTRERLAERQERPPTWRGAFVRAMVAAVMMLAILLIFKLTSAAQAVALFPLVLVMYVPVGYYTERWSYNRRQRSKGRKPTKAAPR